MASKEMEYLASNPKSIQGNLKVKAHFSQLTKNKKKAIYDFLIVFLALSTAYFAWKWISSDSSGESQFAIITGFLIPFVLYLRSFERELPNTKLRSNTLSSMLSVANDIQVKILKRKIRSYIPNVDYGVQVEIEIFATKKIVIKSMEISLQEVIGYGNERRVVSDPRIFKSLNEDFLSAATSEIFKEKLASHREIEINLYV
ncbi:hypothetical protein [Nodosilinea sp. E11]|uniref:hypothetical protein n=1 Tax=Nodosilinea sp. E11 TaxID=3037479 RepID=UPI002934EA90|nr:hypothetical protein [Nodosilinea sp. E11]WOD37922.1 hypothetical protein RRF56_17050 [Nodosilinea sp. E11]